VNQRWSQFKSRIQPCSSSIATDQICRTHNRRC
jgi:hypothetical protein